MHALPDELLLSAGSVSGRGSDTQHLLYGLQHCALAAAIGARHKVDVGTADRHEVDVGTAGRGCDDMRGQVPSRERHFQTWAIAVTVYRLYRSRSTAAMHVLWQDLKVRLGTVDAASVLHDVDQPAQSSCT